MIWGYHHLRKHPYRWILDDSKKTSLQLWKVDNVNLMMVKLPKNQRLDPPKKEGILWLSFLEGSAWDLQTISFLRSHDSLGRWVSGKKQVDFKKEQFSVDHFLFWNPGSFPSSSVHFWCSYLISCLRLTPTVVSFASNATKGPLKGHPQMIFRCSRRFRQGGTIMNKWAFEKGFFCFFSKKQKKHIGQNSVKLFFLPRFTVLTSHKVIVFHKN